MKAYCIHTLHAYTGFTGTKEMSNTPPQSDDSDDMLAELERNYIKEEREKTRTCTFFLGILHRHVAARHSTK